MRIGVKRGLRIVGLLAALLIVAGVVYLHTPAFRHGVERRLRAFLSEQTGRGVVLRLDDLRPFAASARIAELRIDGRGPRDAPFLELAESEIDFRLTSLLRRRLHLSELSIERLRVDLDQLPAGADSTEPPVGADGVSVSDLTDLVRIDHGIVTHGRLRFTDPQTGIGLDADGIRIELKRTDVQERSRGSVHVASGTIDIPDRGDVPFAVAAEIDLADESLGFSSSTLRSAGVEVGWTGRLTDLVPLRGTAEFELELHPERLPAPLRSGAAIRGAIRTTGTASFDAPGYEIDLDLRSPEIGWGDWVANDAVVALTGSQEAWDSEFSLSVQGVALEGEIHGAPPPGLVPLRARLDLATENVGPLVGTAMLQDAAAVRGSALGHLSAEAEALRADAVRGTFRIEADGLAPRDAPDLALTLKLEGSMRDGTLHVDHLVARGPGASIEARGAAGVDDHSTARIDVRIDSAGESLRALRRALEAFGVDVAIPDGLDAARGGGELSARFEGPGMRDFTVDAVTGDVTMRAVGLAASNQPGLEIDGDIAAAFRGGELDVRRVELLAPGIRVEASGGVSVSGASRLAFDSEIDALGRSANAVVGELLALGLRDPGWPFDRIDPVTGTLRLQGRLDGPWSAPSGDLAFRIDGFGLPDHPPRAVQIAATLHEGRVDAHGGLVGNGNELALDLRAGPLAARPMPGALRAELMESSPEWWMDLAGIPVETEGALEGTVSLDLRTLTARADVSVANAAVAGTPFELRGAALTISPERLEIASAELLAFGGRATVDGALGEGETAAVEQGTGLRVRGEKLDIARVLRASGVPFEAAGALDFEAHVTGTRTAPSVAGDFSLGGLSFQGQPLPDLAGPAFYDGGDFAVDLVEPDGESRIRAEGSLDTGVPWSIDARYPVRIDLDRLADLSDAPDSGLHLDLRAVLRGESGDLATVTGSIEALDTLVQLGPETFTTDRGPVLDFDNGTARLRPFELRGMGTVLRTEGDLALTEPHTLSVGTTGTVALAPLASLIPDARMDGTASVDVRVAGPLAAPTWEGTAGLTDGRLDHPVLSFPLENIEAAVEVDPDRWRLDDLSMRVGGGDVRGSGEYVARGPAAGTIHVELDGDGLRMRPLDGLRLETDTGLRLDGRIDDVLTLSGRFDVARAAYERDLEFRDQLLARSRESVGTTGVGNLLDRVRLGIDVDAPGSVYVRNNVASAEATVRLEVGGTAVEPRLTGRVELLKGGRWFFRGVTYSLTRGAFEYIDATPDDPTVDIEAETTVDTYDIRLTVSGRLQDPLIELLSTPSLPQADIVSLLVTGKTRDDMSSSGGLSGAQAALYLTRDFTRAMEASLKRSLGIDELRIDPVLVEGDAEPTARLTVVKSITGKVSATYSTALAGNQGDIYQLRYRPRERVSLVGGDDEDGELAGDVMFNRSFYVGPPRPTGGEHGARDAAPRLSGVTIDGNEAIKTRRLRRDLGVGKGHRVRRPVLLAGVDTIRDRYLERGYPEAGVEVESIAGADGLTVAVAVDEGRKVEVILEGLGRKRRGLRKKLLELWQQSVFLDAVDADAAAFVLDRVRAKGYARATVDAAVVTHNPDDLALRVTVDRGRRVRVERLLIEGGGSLEEERIRAQLLTREAGLLRRGRLSSDLLTQDREAVLRLLRAEGYLDAEVGEPEVSYPSSNDRAVVRIVVDEGRRYRLGRIGLVGTEALDGETLDGIVSLKQGEPFIDAEIRAARSRLRRAYDQRGYPEVGVELRTQVDRTAGTMDVDLVVDEGPHKIIESVEVAGTALTRPRVVEREIGVEAGQPWSADAVAATRQKLYRTGLFKSVGVSEDAGDTLQGRRLRFDVQEGKNVRTDYGLGASTDDGARARFSVSHLNLWGRRLYGSTGGRVSEKEWRVFALARQPRLFGSRLEGLLSTFLEKEEENAFDIRRVGFTLQVSDKIRKDRVGWFLGYGLSKSEVSQGGVEVEPGAVPPPGFFDAVDLRDESIVRLGTLNAGLVASSLDDPGWPTRGSLWRAELSWFDEGFASEAEFLRGSVQWRFHHGLGPRTVWNVGARVGMADPYGISDFVPISERFFAGGDDTIRGFSSDSIDAVGFPADELAAAGIFTTESLGGDARFIVNNELVRPLYGPLSIAAFHDAGNVYWRIEDFDLGDFRHAAGLGLRMRTPIGPLRVEYGWKLDREPRESRGHLHFSLGMAF